MRLAHLSPVETVHLRFADRTVVARRGETVAAALTAAGIVALRETPDGSPRGVHCGMGACFDCIVAIDGRASQRACMTTVADGMRIGPAPPAAPPGVLPERNVTPDVLVVGAGPAGLSAAIAAHESGADVLLLDERGASGGQYFKPAIRPDARSRRGDRLRARAAGVPTLQATAWGAFSGPEIVASTATERMMLRPRQLILALGAHEAPVPLPGWTLPGCVTTGALQGLVRTHAVSPGRRVVIAGNGPLNLQVAVELLRAGGEVAAVVEAAYRPTGLALLRASPARAWEGLHLLRTLRLAGVPVLWGARPTAVLGERWACGLVVTGPGGVCSIEADAVALHWGFEAETGLARALGAEHRVVDGRLETMTRNDGRTSLPGVYAVGDGARIGGANVAVLRGRAAGLAAAAALTCDGGVHVPLTAIRSGGREGSDRDASRAGPALRRAERVQRDLRRAFHADALDPADLPDGVLVCRCESVTVGALRRGMAGGAGSLATLKRATRAGMGHCAGRFCGATIARLCGAAAEARFAAPRMPVRPVLAAAILAPQPEPRSAPVPAPLPTRWTTVEPATHPGHADIVVIGAGIVGLATALYLARDGLDVLVVDRGEPGLAASTASAGSLHVQLLPYAYEADGGGPLMQALPLGPVGVDLWREVARDAGEDLGLRTEGGLILAETEAELALLRAKSAAERACGIASHVIEAVELRRLEPGLAHGFTGASFCPTEGQGDPLRGTMALLSLARRAGARIACGIEVTGLAQAGPGWCIETSAGAVRAAQVVNAAGAQAWRIAGLAGVSVKSHGLVQQVIATEPTPPKLRHLVAWAGRHLSLKQGAGGHLLVGGGWPGYLDGHGAAQVRRDSLEGNLALACRVLPALQGVHVLRAWAGLTPGLDRPPIICATPGRAGLWHGVTGNGYTLGPVVGRMLADAAQGRGVLPGAFGLSAPDP